MGSKNADFNKNKKKNKSKHSAADTDGKIHREGGRKIIADPRFASVHSDPRFQKDSKPKSKFPIDSRFTVMFNDEKFSTGSAPSDKRGKPKKHKPENSLIHFYRSVEDPGEDAEKKKKAVSEEEESEEEEEVEAESDREELGRLDSESAGSESSSELEASNSDDTESTTDEDEEVIYADDEHEVQVENIPTIEDGTRRLAVVNMDWRHVRAVDLYVVLRSFLPKGGDILSVSVFPSEFGLQQMKEEEINGPVGLFDGENKNNKNGKSGEDDDDSDDDDEIDDEKLRAYEKSRMRYYYAVVECSSVATAEHLYKSCDGVEFERSSNVLDLRFIPDSMEFKHPPRDIATEAPGGYDGLDFHTKALQHSSIPISWDEDEPQRAKTLKQKFNADQLADLELKEYLASDESESDEEENVEGAENGTDKKLKKRDKYRALIQSGDGSDEEETQDMEITFNTGLEGLSKRILEKRDKKAETVWEEHLRKQREKKKARKNKSKHSSDDESSDDEEEIKEAGDFFVEEPSAKKAKHESRGKNDKEEKQLQSNDEAAEASRAELELLLADDDGVDNGLKGYNLKSKGKKGNEVPDESKIPAADYDDPRFSALFKSSLFALDPTDPQFKRSATYARQVAHKQQKGENELVDAKSSQLSSNEAGLNKNEMVNSKKEKYEISSLVKSIKMKSNHVKLPSKGESKKDEKLKQRDTVGIDKLELSSLIKSVKKKAKVIKN